MIKDILRPYLRAQFVLDEDLCFESQTTNNTSPVITARFLETTMRYDFGQLLFEANLKADEPISYFETTLKENKELQEAIQDRIDL